MIEKSHWLFTYARKAFCQQENITYQTLHYWLKCLGAEERSGFTEIKVDELRSNGYEVIFPSGTRIIF